MTKPGILYGIGVGPGDPDLLTLKAAKVLQQCHHVFVPKSKTEKGSTALGIARSHLKEESRVHELVFPMTADKAELARHWDEAARRMAEVIRAGEDACFLTLGDSLLYSTYIYLLRALRRKVPDIEVVTIPGITAFSAAAAMTEFAVGEGSEPITIVPMADSLDAVRGALLKGGTVIVMKVGRHLSRVLDVLAELNLLDQGVFVSCAGMEGERIEPDLQRLREENYEASYFSILLIHAPSSRL